ncbi:GAP1-N1 domain-containing protein [Pseudomonas sp. LS2P72]
MINVEIQVHGYRKGHQLLASSIALSKDDQAVVDRLSDVAGPLRPKEEFAPYLSTYPLPSGTYYVIARTWQDLTVPRAGCVRTKSVLIDARAWALKPPLIPILRLLGSAELPSEKDAKCVELEDQVEEQLPPTPSFSASELLEALFFEDAKPVVMFDAPDPELIALRLLTALWPGIRRRFALSTFALSPRKIGGRDLDLVFAPLSAKAKFSDWGGRRVDGRSLQNDRHKWTGTIVRRVFEDPVPKLLSSREIELLGDRESDSAAALRIALLWDELLDKLYQTPTAALGLLDIANSGMVSNKVAMKLLEPRLAEATRQVADSLSHSDAWDFVGAIARKMQGQDMPASRTAIEQLVAYLAKRAPGGAVNLLRQPDPKGTISDLIPFIATGLGKGAAPDVEQVLTEAPADIIARIVSQGGALVSRVANDDGLIERMGLVLSEVDQELANRAGSVLLPYLIDDRQLPAAAPIFNRLDSQGLADELRWLGDANDFQAERLSAMLIKRARKVGGLPSVRDVLISSEASARSFALLSMTVNPVKADVLWLLDEKRLSHKVSADLIKNVLERADDKQLAVLLFDHTTAERLVARLPDDSIDILARAIMQDSLPMNAYARVIGSVIPKVNDARKFEIAERVIGKCLRNRFDGDETAILHMLLGTLGARIDGGWAVQTGLDASLDAELVSRNLIVFETAPLPARNRVVGAVREIANALQARHVIDLNEAASDACAKLMFDAEQISSKALLDAAGRLVPLLLRSRRQPVSPLIAAMFPSIYRELSKANDVPDLLKIFPFFDWDRCKAARIELVDAFMSSSWRAGDLAATACRCGDVAKILKQVAGSHGGEKYLTRIENDLDRLDDGGRHLIKNTAAQIRAEKSYKPGY